MPYDIRLMDAEAARRIVAGQAVMDLASAVKELVDNALDAGSQSINIRLFNQGVDIIEVSDDGCGVPLSSRPHLATLHTTSKIQRFEDIYDNNTCHTLGFRGEALFCLANLSGRLIVATRTANDAVAQKLEYQRDGTLNSANITEMPRKVGTTMAVVKLFEAVPVRRADMIRNLAKQRGKLMKCMEAYAIFSVGVRINLMDMVGSDCRESTLLATTANTTTLQETISSVLGSKFLASVTPIQISLDSAFADESEKKPEAETDNTGPTRTAAAAAGQYKIDGFLAIAGPGVKAPPRPVQYFSINGRPVLLPKVSRVLNDVWRTSFGQSKKPSCIFRFTLPRACYDINVSPDKREVILTQEDKVLHLIQQYASQLWCSNTSGRFTQRIIMQIESGDQGAEEEEEIIDSRAGMFKRRYAFMHDFSNARMQHEYADKRCKVQDHDDDNDANDDKSDQHVMDDETHSDSAEATARAEECNDSESPAVEQDPSYSPQRPIGNEEPAPRNYSSRKRQRTDFGDHKQSAAVTPSPCNNNDGLAGDILLSPVRKSLRDPDHLAKLTPTERQQWRQTQENFNRSPGMQEDIATIESSKANQNNNNKTPPTKCNTNDNEKLTKYGFEVLGYRAVKRVSNDRAEHGGKSSSSFGTIINIPPISTGVRRVSGLDEDSPPSPTSYPSPYNPLDQSGDDQQCSRQSPPPACEPDGSYDNQEDARPSMETTGEQALDAATSVVWSSFQGTDQVIELSRRHRLALRDRKLALQQTSTALTPEVCDPNNVSARSSAASKSEATISLSKKDFKENMTIIGQFNMGFILAKTRDNHLWILDQHACDEKYNFEKLCAETTIHEQRLMAPLPLELSPAEETCIMDNMELFEKNGFRFEIDESKPPRHRIALTALPHSGARDGRKAVQFGKEDVAALCAILGADGSSSSYEAMDGSGNGTDGSGMYGNNAVRRYAGAGDSTDRIIARLPKAVAMFASRACRGSIMIGKALSDTEMTRIVQRLGDLQHPWQCPHGRTTLNHVGNLNALMLKDERKAMAHVAGPTGTMLSQENDE